MMAVEALLRKRKFIVENIYDISPILDHLLSASVISFDQRDEIMVKELRSKRTDELINVLTYDIHQTAVEEFCKALALTGYEFVADEIKTAINDVGMKAPVPEQESDWLYSSLDQHRRCQLVTDKEIHSFTRALQPADLHNIAVELKISSHEFEQYRTCEPQSVSAQAYKLLSDWTVNEGGSATVANFVLTMRSAGIADYIIKSALLHSHSQ